MSDRDTVRTIDQGAPPTRYARGWHCLGLADTFRTGGPHAVEAFGTKLVVFADSRGALHVLDAFCRHMGGDLTMGTVKDRKSTRLNSSHANISYAVFCLKKKKNY